MAKTCVACAYAWTGGYRPRLKHWSRKDTQPFIVGYHRVVESFDRSKSNAIPALLISATMLERHIDWIAKRYAIASIDDIARHLEANQPFLKPTAAVTFDDGYSDVYEYAFPLLQRKGIPSAVFVVTDLMGTGRPQIFDRLYLVLRRMQQSRLPLQFMGLSEADALKLMTLALNTFPQAEIEAALTSLERRFPIESDELEGMAPLTWDMVRRMDRAGVTIGSHTASHCLLPSESIETARRELVSSRLTLQAELGHHVGHFAYPDGRYNPEVVEAVARAGYWCAYSICDSRDARYPLLTIPRKMLWERSCLNALERFSPTVMNWLVNRKQRCEHDHVWKNHSNINYR
jgi:peptidoglycan/xylan/chitin deacetylase (PgdA/CDA1 family)